MEDNHLMRDKQTFNINTNSGIITYNSFGFEKIQNEDRIILNAIDPNGLNITLWEHTFLYHILSSHNGNDSRDYLNSDHNMARIISSINNPNYILIDKSNEDRLEYVTLTDIENNGITRLKSLSIITEESKTIENSYEIVTIVPKSSASMDITNRSVVYNVHNNTIWI